MRDVLALTLGYLLGTVSPAWLIGRLRGVDLRTLGDGNLGATNARDQFGPAAGRLTAAVDMLKGPAAVALAASLGAGEWAVYGTGLTAILGHRYPFYLGFRGGRGFATASGLLISALVYSLAVGWLPAVHGAVLVAAFFALAAAFGDRGVPNALLLPVAYADLAWHSPSVAYDVALGVVAGSVWLFNFGRMRREHLLSRGVPGR